MAKGGLSILTDTMCECVMCETGALTENRRAELRFPRSFWEQWGGKKGHRSGNDEPEDGKKASQIRINRHV